MSVQKILPVARKMGEENFAAYKQYVKNVKQGQNQSLAFDLKGVNIIDAVNIKGVDGLDTEGLRNLLRLMFQKFFPRAASPEAEKNVLMSCEQGKDWSKTIIATSTKEGEDIVGTSFYKMLKAGKRFMVDLKTKCEDAKFKLSTAANLENTKQGENIQINLPVNPFKGFQFVAGKKKSKLVLNTEPTDIVRRFHMSLEIPNDIIKKFKSPEFEQEFPELVKKSGFKF